MKRFAVVLLVFCVFLGGAAYAEGIGLPMIAEKTEGDFYSLRLVLPELEGFEGAAALEEELRNRALDSIGDINLSARNLTKDGALGMPVTLQTKYRLSQGGDILSIRMDGYQYMGGAHGTSWNTGYTVNTATGQAYRLADLGKEGANLAAYIERRIIEQINAVPEPYFEDAIRTVQEKNGDFDFFLDGPELIVHFPLYELTPYAAGFPYFVFPIDEISAYVKPELAAYAEEAAPWSWLAVNGRYVPAAASPYMNEDYEAMVPLRAAAEALGYVVDWNPDDGALVAGGAVQNGTTEYSAKGKTAVLSPAVVKDGVTYVPSAYFAEVLEEQSMMSFDSLGFATYGEPKPERYTLLLYQSPATDSFLQGAVDFQKSDDPSELARLWAEAVKNRNGAAQYGLMSPALRREMYPAITGLGFVTGTSSPWVKDYQIQKAGEGEYEIVFTLTTSASDVLTEKTVLRLGLPSEENNFSCEIIAIVKQ